MNDSGQPSLHRAGSRWGGDKTYKKSKPRQIEASPFGWACPHALPKAGQEGGVFVLPEVLTPVPGFSLVRFLRVFPFLWLLALPFWTPFSYSNYLTLAFSLALDLRRRGLPVSAVGARHTSPGQRGWLWWLVLKWGCIYPRCVWARRGSDFSFLIFSLGKVVSGEEHDVLFLFLESDCFTVLC